MDDRDTKQSAGYFKEKAIIAWSSIKGNEVDKAIQKVTSHMLKAPKEKYLYLLIGMTYRRNGIWKKNGKPICEYILYELQKRSHTHNWIVVLKSLVTLHRLMEEGSEDFLHSILESVNVFSFNLKDIAEDQDSSQQKEFIIEYMYYLEEKRQMQLLLGYMHSVEADNFEQYLENLSRLELWPICTALTRTIGTIGKIVFRNSIINNFCTLEAHDLLVRDGKRLLHILSKQIIKVLESFEELSSSEQAQWLELYEYYSDAIDSLKRFFDSLNMSSHVFVEHIPSLKPLPETMLIHLQEIMRLRAVQSETCSLNDIKLNVMSKQQPNSTSINKLQEEDERLNQGHNRKSSIECIAEENYESELDEMLDAEWSSTEEVQENKEEHKPNTVETTLDDLLVFNTKRDNNEELSKGNASSSLSSSSLIEKEMAQKLTDVECHETAKSNTKAEFSLDKLFEPALQTRSTNINEIFSYDKNATNYVNLISQNGRDDNSSKKEEPRSHMPENTNNTTNQQWSTGAPYQYNMQNINAPHFSETE